MPAKLFEPVLLTDRNVLTLGHEIYAVLEGEWWDLKLTFVSGDSVVHRQVGLEFDDREDVSVVWGENREEPTNSSLLSIALDDVETLLFELRDDIYLEWLGPTVFSLSVKREPSTNEAEEDQVVQAIFSVVEYEPEEDDDDDDDPFWVDPLHLIEEDADDEEDNAESTSNTSDIDG